MTERGSGRTSAEIYEVQPYYRRFNQKYNMTRQRCWDERTVEIQRKRDANLRQRVGKGRNGYSSLDWAFYAGAWANGLSSGFVNNWPNRRGNSWQPLAARVGHQGPVPCLSLGRWQGTPTAASSLMHNLGLRFGASQVGFCRLDRRWVYSHWFDEETKGDYPIKFSDEPGYEGHSQPVQLDDGTQVIPKEMEYVVVLIHEMDRLAIAAAPYLAGSAEVGLTYSKIAFTAVSLAESIRALGYHAIPSSNCTALSIPLAIDAGLGQLGRNAKLINPMFGPRCRISKVITDLPLAVRKPVDLGVTEFCNQCQKCARKCPARAIPLGERSFEPVNECSHRGVLQWQMDHKKCDEYCAEVATGCGICIRVCPFNKGRGMIHGGVRWSIRNLRFVDPLVIKLDDALGYGEYVPSDQT